MYFRQVFCLLAFILMNNGSLAQSPFFDDDSTPPRESHSRAGNSDNPFLGGDDGPSVDRSPSSSNSAISPGCYDWTQTCGTDQRIVAECLQNTNPILGPYACGDATTNTINACRRKEQECGEGNSSPTVDDGGDTGGGYIGSFGNAPIVPHGSGSGSDISGLPHR